MDELIGIGVYTAAEAGRLLRVPPAKIARWLRGHHVGDHRYQALWAPQIDLGDGGVCLGFRDLMEVRVADRFIGLGVSPQRVRAAIRLARDIIGEDRPLSTTQFRTDGRDIFVRVVELDEQGQSRERLLNLFRRQYEFKQIIDPLLTSVDFNDDGIPRQWWPQGRRGNILVDPARAFGQPIDAMSSVPTAVLAAAGRWHGIEGGARIYDVPPASVKRALDFEAAMVLRAAA